MSRPRSVGAALLGSLLAASPAAAQLAVRQPFRFGAEVKAHYRDSHDVAVEDHFPFPPNFLPPGQDKVFLRTVEPGRAFEVSTLNLHAEGDVFHNVFLRIEVHVRDFYNRNPTSADDRFKLREAFVRIGPAVEPLAVGDAEGSSLYLTAGLAPRFTKQVRRRLESYGLWGTAVGRFEEPQVQAGGVVNGRFYWRAMLANGNPVFFRDTNALAGDNGTPQRQPGNVFPIHQSGFPVLYDAQRPGASLSGRFEWGGGIGVKGGGLERAVDIFGWYFARRLQDRVDLPGTTYSGDLQLLRGNGQPLPFRGDRKREWGVNAEARAGGLRFFGQWVDQEIAGLPRSGFEAEFAWRFEPRGHLLQPVVRFSRIDNDWTTPDAYPGPSVGWDWRKLDLGLRVGVAKGTDVTLEYSRHDMQVDGRSLHPDEVLVTLRAGF